MILNKINVLDKGFVSLLASSNTDKEINDIQDYYYKGATHKGLSDIATATFIIKCPLFVHLYFTRFNLSIIATPPKELEAYIPDESEIGGKDAMTAKDMKENIEQATAALLINPKTLQHDKCDKYISQVMTPISTYTEIIVHGSLSDWVELLNKSGLPSPINAYKEAIEEVLSAEWKKLDDYK